MRLCSLGKFAFVGGSFSPHPSPPEAVQCHRPGISMDIFPGGSGGDLGFPSSSVLRVNQLYGGGLGNGSDFGTQSCLPQMNRTDSSTLVIDSNCIMVSWERFGKVFFGEIALEPRTPPPNGASRESPWDSSKIKLIDRTNLNFR